MLSIIYSTCITTCSWIPTHCSSIRRVFEVEFERLEHSLGKAKGIGEKDKVLGRFLNRASSQQEYNIKARGQKPRVRKRGGTVSRRGGGKIMQGYKAGGKV